MTRTYYLSFADDEAFRGGCFVDVTEADAAMARLVIAKRFPHARPGTEWVAAASQVAHRLGCNPGGAMMAIHLDRAERMPTTIERGRLYSKAELEEQ